jgi:hypothetical protein
MDEKQNKNRERACELAECITLYVTVDRRKQGSSCAELRITPRHMV